MKKKDIFYLALAVLILVVAGYIGYTQFLGKSASGKAIQVEVVGAITSEMSSNGLATISDPSKTQDFFTAIDLNTGLKNAAPFGP